MLTYPTQVKRLDPTKVKYLVVHCTATPPDLNWTVKEVDDYHTKVRGYAAIGYHFLIRRDGILEIGRPTTYQGAHVKGHNHESIGVALVGGITDAKTKAPANNFTRAQFLALFSVLQELRPLYPKAKILGHRDFPGVAKACPCFDAGKWYTYALDHHSALAGVFGGPGTTS